MKDDEKDKEQEAQENQSDEQESSDEQEEKKEPEKKADKKKPAPEKKQPAKETDENQEKEQPQEQADDSADEIARLKAELLSAKAQAEAARLGFKADVIEDAVFLAVRAAGKDKEPDEESVKTALAEVLKKYPEWKTVNDKPAGFRIGAPEPKGDGAPQRTVAKNRWNRFN
ncbi:MAG: hypothetical protein IJM75_06275 [Ruminococcus sp.]|nr:hypothetical protein [Ruminococcus sp.]